MDLKTRQINGKSSEKWAATGHSPRISFLLAFTIDLSRFEVYFSCGLSGSEKRQHFGTRLGMGDKD